MAEIDVTRIAGNIGAMNSLNSLTNINKKLSIHQTRLATGKRINTAADDPAGLTIATKMMSRSEGLKTALNNIGDAKNLLAVAESGMGRVNDILVQMRNLSEAGASDTMGTEERAALVTQMTAYAEQIDDIVNQTKWNDKMLLDGSITTGSELRFQTGADQDDATMLNSIANLSALDASGLDIGTEGNVAASGGTVVGGGVTAVAAPAAGTNSSLSELSAGDYVVRITYGDTGTAGAVNGETSTIQLFAASDTSYSSPILIDTDNSGDGGAVNTVTASLDLSGVGTTDVDLGNGMVVTVTNGLDGVQDTAVSGYTPATTEIQLKLSSTANDADGILTKDSSAAAFAQYMNDIENKLNIVSNELSKLGSLTGRLTFKEDQISAAQINTEAAYNRIMNANMAEEQVNASKFQILQQTATAMLAQANAAPQFLLSLFR